MATSYFDVFRSLENINLKYGRIMKSMKKVWRIVKEVWRIVKELFLVIASMVGVVLIVAVIFGGIVAFAGGLTNWNLLGDRSNQTLIQIGVGLIIVVAAMIIFPLMDSGVCRRSGK